MLNQRYTTYTYYPNLWLHIFKTFFSRNKYNPFLGIDVHICNICTRMAKDTLTFRVNPETKSFLEREAGSDKRTTSWLIESIVEDWKNKQIKRKLKVKQG